MRTLVSAFSALSCIAVALCGNKLPAQTAAEALPQRIRAARAAFRPVTQADVSAQHASLTQVIDRLGRYLDTGASNGRNWKRFLRWDEMNQQLAKGAHADFDVLNDIQSRYTSGYAGFEMPVYADVGKALRRYVDTLQAHLEPEARRQYEARIDALADDVAAYLARPAETDTHRAGEILGELAATGQAPQVIRAVRDRLSHPNVLIEASEQFVAAGIKDPVNDSGPVTDVILGTRICGTVQTVGYVNAELGNTSNYASIDVLMQGTAYSNTVGYNGPAVIYSSGVTGLGGRKRLILDEFGLRAYPADSNACTNTTINGVSVNAKFLAGLVQRVATKRVYQSKSQAEAIAAAHAESRLNQRMDSQSLGLVGRANRDFWGKFRSPLLRVGAFPERLNFRSFGNRLAVLATRADAYQIGAPTPPAPVPATDDVLVRFHESAIENFGSTALAGRTLTRDQINRLMRNMTGKIPDELQDEDGRDWSITFAIERPIAMQINGGGVAVTIRGEQFTSGDNAYPAMNITARYRLEKNARGGLRAVRDGDLEILPPDFKPGVDQLSASQQSLKTILERRFAKLFKPELPDKPTAGLELSGNWKKAGPLPIETVSADGGWLTLGWSMPRRSPASKQVAATPDRATR